MLYFHDPLYTAFRSPFKTAGCGMHLCFDAVGVWIVSTEGIQHHIAAHFVLVSNP